MNKISILVIIFLLSITNFSYSAYVCHGNQPKVYNISEINQDEIIQQYSNDIVKIESDEDIKVVDVFDENGHTYQGLVVKYSSKLREDISRMSFFDRLFNFFKSSVEYSYDISLFLNDKTLINEVQGLNPVMLYVKIKESQSKKEYSFKLKFNQDVSENCRPK